MATLQKIRSNKITQFAIGAGMLAFIAGSAVEILRSSRPDTEVAEMNGKSLDYAELNQMVDDYKDVLQTMGQLPQGEVSSDILAQIREQVFQQYVQRQLLDEQCDKLGITVTDAELQNIIKTGSHPLLAQTIFRNKQGGFDYASLQQFLKQREEAMKNGQITAEQREQLDKYYRYWCFIENEIKYSTKMEKYQVLMAGLMMSNPISAKDNFEGRTQQTDILLAGLPFTSLDDKNFNATDEELKAKYEEYKEAFYQPNNTRDIKYIDVAIKASKADKDALDKSMAEYAEQLKKPNAVIESVVRQSQSTVNYARIPVSAKALPQNIAARLDSMPVGTQTEPFYTMDDNSMNIIKLISKVSLPDSVEVRQIIAANQDVKKAEKSADSIVAALKAGANFDTIAKAYNQPATKQWITSNMYENAQIDDNNKKYLETITGAPTGSINKIDMENGFIIAEITDRRAMVDKYDVATIKRSIDFSNETANQAYNELGTFLASHRTLDEWEKAKDSKFAILDRKDLEAMTHELPGISDSREVIRWAFKDETNVGDISEIQYCGKTRDHLVVAALTAVHEAGYRDMSDENIKNNLKALVIQDKKAAKLQDEMKGAKDLAAVAKMSGAVTDTIQHITFNAPAYIQKMGGASEPAVSGAASAAAQGKFISGVRGNAGVYAFQVLAKNKSNEKYDQKTEMQQAAMNNMRLLGSMFQADPRNPMSIFNTAYKNAKIVDRRNLFY